MTAHEAGRLQDSLPSRMPHIPNWERHSSSERADTGSFSYVPIRRYPGKLPGFDTSGQRRRATDGNPLMAEQMNYRYERI